MSNKKKPGARPGDFVYRGKNGPIPLPPFSEFDPDADVAAEFADLQEWAEGKTEAELASDPAKAAEISSAAYRLIKSGIPNRYLPTFRPKMSEIGDILEKWNEHGVNPGKSLTS